MFYNQSYGQMRSSSFLFIWFSVINSVLWFSIYSVLRIWSNVPVQPVSTKPLGLTRQVSNLFQEPVEQQPFLGFRIAEEKTDRLNILTSNDHHRVVKFDPRFY